MNLTIIKSNLMVGAQWYRLSTVDVHSVALKPIHGKTRWMDQETWYLSPPAARRPTCPNAQM